MHFLRNRIGTGCFPALYAPTITERYLLPRLDHIFTMPQLCPDRPARALSCRCCPAATLEPVVHSRWTTTQSRVLRLYLSETKPSHQLKRLVNFITKVYVPTLMSAKRLNKVKDGPALLLQEIQAVRQHCTIKERDVLEASIQGNGFFAHHEAVLVSLLSSDTAGDREYAVNLIRNIRNTPSDWSSNSTGLRPYKVRTRSH